VVGTPRWFESAMCYSVTDQALYMATRYTATTPIVNSIVRRLPISEGQISRGPFTTMIPPDPQVYSVLYTSKLDMGFRRVKKSIPSILVEGSNLSTGSYLVVSATFDGSTELLTFPGVSQSGITELYCSDASSDSTKEFYNATFEVRFFTLSSTVTPILEGLTIRFLMRPDVFYGYSFTIIAAQSVVYGNEQDDRSPQDYLTDLRTARDSKAPIEFIDLYGTSHVCYISSVSVQAVERHENSNDGSVNIEAFISVNLVEAA